MNTINFNCVNLPFFPETLLEATSNLPLSSQLKMKTLCPFLMLACEWVWCIQEGQANNYPLNAISISIESRISEKSANKCHCTMEGSEHRNIQLVRVNRTRVNGVSAINGTSVSNPSPQGSGDIIEEWAKRW